MSRRGEEFHALTGYGGMHFNSQRRPRVFFGLFLGRKWANQGIGAHFKQRTPEPTLMPPEIWLEFSVARSPVT